MLDETLPDTLRTAKNTRTLPFLARAGTLPVLPAHPCG